MIILYVIYYNTLEIFCSILWECTDPTENPLKCLCWHLRSKLLSQWNPKLQLL